MFIIAVVVPFLAVGCGNVVRVTRASTPLPDSGKLDGVPFYGVGYRCVHTTVWIQPIYTVSVSVTFPDGKVDDLGTKTFGLSSFQTRVQQFLFTASITIGSDADERRFESAWEQISGDINAYKIDEDNIAQQSSLRLC
jgi:hypothetical protein